MKNLAVLLAVVGLLSAVFVASMATWVWFTIPDAPDPQTLPTRAFDAPAPAYASAAEEGRSIARTLLAEEKLPGLSLAVAIDGNLVWAEGFRFADLESEVPVTPDTQFRIGGASMGLSSTAAGLLVQRGLLDLDAPIQRYLPEFPEKEWPISTRQLLAHVAGIRPFRGEGGIFRGGDCDDDTDRLAAFAEDPLQSRPGTEFHFSTYGYALVGAVIAAVSGEPYVDFVQRELLDALGMTRTLPERGEREYPEAAHFYYPRLMLNPRYGVHDAPTVELSCHLPAVGYLSTPSDLVRFASALMGAELLDPATVKELQTPVRLESGAFTGEALGWDIASSPMGEEAEMTGIVGQGLGEVVRNGPLSASSVGGQVAGSTTTLLMVPTHRVAVAVATNVTGAKNVALLAERLADVFVRSR